MFKATHGSFDFQVAKVGPEPNSTIEVFHHRASGVDLRSAPILIVMPGNRREARDYRDSWDELAEQYGAILLVPHFPRDPYDTASYNRGNLLSPEGKPNPEERWTFATIEALYQWVADEIGSTTKGYQLYGHSAGAQFVHRFMLYMTDHRVLQAVSANAGWYTVPDPSVEFPYGIADGPSISLDKALSAPLVIMVGIDDDDPDADGLRTTSEANDQGRTRYERALFFFAEAKAIADDENIDLRWTLQIVPEVGHSNYDMAPAAAKILLNP